jgi:MFS family permease
MQAIVATLLVVMVPQLGLATLQLALPVVAPAMMHTAGMPPEAFGWVSGASGLGSMLFFLANHAITPAIGPLQTLRAGALIAVAGGLLLTSGTFAVLLAGALLIGFGYASTTPAGSQILADHTPKRRWGFLFSLRQAGVPLGGVIAGAIGGPVIDAYGWRPAIAGIAAICATLGLALLLAPRRYNEGALRPFTALALLDPGNLVRPFRIVHETAALRPIVGACIGFAIIQSTVQAFFVTYLVSALGLGLALAGWLFAIQQAASVAGRIVLGLVADRIGSPHAVLRLLALLTTASVLVLVGLAPGWTAPALVAMSAFVGFSIATWNGLYLAMIAMLVAPEKVSEATAGCTFFVFTTYMLAPVAAGLLIAAHGYRTAYATAAAAGLLAAAILFRAPSRRPAVSQRA